MFELAHAEKQYLLKVGSCLMNFLLSYSFVLLFIFLQFQLEKLKFPDFISLLLSILF